MRWFLALVVGVVVVVSGAGPSRAAAAQAATPDTVARPGALVLVERLTTDEALAAVGPGVAVGGFVSTLPVHQPLASRVLSLAAGRRVDALDALEANPAAASSLPDPATVERIRADNPGASFGRLPPQTRVLAYPGLEAAGLFALGPSGPPPSPSPLGPGDALIPVRPGQLLVLAVPDAATLANVVGRLLPAEGAGPVMVLGLRAAPGRANTAPLLVLRQPDARGLVTSGLDPPPRPGRPRGRAPHHRRRPTAGDDGTSIELVDEYGPAAAVTRIDRRVAALVTARTWAIPLLCLAAVLSLFALLATWRNRAGGPSRAAAAARSLLALTLALPRRVPGRQHGRAGRGQRLAGPVPRRPARPRRRPPLGGRLGRRRCRRRRCPCRRRPRARPAQER